MRINGINEIEIADENMPYDRVKLNIAFDSEKECRDIWDAIKKENSEVEDSYWNKFDPVKDLELLAYLHYNHVDSTVTVEGDLISAYFDGEWDFPNSWLKPHAFNRCKEYVADLYKEHTLEEIYSEFGIFCPVTKADTAIARAAEVKRLYGKTA